jgi:hypothetical protein
MVLTHDDLVLDPAAYAEERPARRARAIAYKKNRRVSVGDMVTLLFEDRETLLFQTQEMVFAEGIRDHAAVQAELDTYNPLLPASLTVGESNVPAVGEGGRSRSDYTSTVHYLRFRLSDDERDAFRDPSVRVMLNVEHDNYSESTPVDGDVRLSLIKDLALG